MQTVSGLAAERGPLYMSLVRWLGRREPPSQDEVAEIFKFSPEDRAWLAAVWPQLMARVYGPM